MAGGKVVYIADIDQDIDDIIAADYLHGKGVLDCVVIDPQPKSDLGKQRVKQMQQMGITVKADIPKDTKVVFNGGAFTKLAKYLQDNTLELLVANGGFVGCNVLDVVLPKFTDKTYNRTYNFNIDVESTIKVLESSNVGKFYLVGKAVCHNVINTTAGIWKDYSFLNKYSLNPVKLLHDLLMVHEGLNVLQGCDLKLEYVESTCVYEDLRGNMTKWGTERGGRIYSAVAYK